MKSITRLDLEATAAFKATGKESARQDVGDGGEESGDEGVVRDVGDVRSDGGDEGVVQDVRDVRGEDVEGEGGNDGGSECRAEGSLLDAAGVERWCNTQSLTRAVGP